MGTKLYVGNLSFEATEGDVLDLFSKVGNVVSCNLIVDKFTNKSRGFAFVEMSAFQVRRSYGSTYWALSARPRLAICPNVADVARSNGPKPGRAMGRCHAVTRLSTSGG